MRPLTVDRARVVDRERGVRGTHGGQTVAEGFQKAMARIRKGMRRRRRKRGE
jgi:hypothetical protein